MHPIAQQLCLHRPVTRLNFVPSKKFSSFFKNCDDQKDRLEIAIALLSSVFEMLPAG